MAMVCPQCSSTFEQRWICPQCNARLVYNETRPAKRRGFSLGRWQQTAWGRVLIGLVLAQGLYHGLRNLCTAGFLVTLEEGQSLWDTMGGVLLLQGLQLFAVLIGGMLAGAGQRQALLHGLVLGLWNGVLCVLLQPPTVVVMTTVTAFGQPILHGAFGALAALLGSLIWSPLPPAAVDPSRLPRKKGAAKRPRRPLLAGPVAWTRVAVGAALCVGGTFWAGALLDFVTDFSRGQLSPSTRWHQQLITWEITAVALLAGSAFAGANTRNGFKQGLAVGLAASIVLVGLRVVKTNAGPAALLLGCVSPLALGIIGGWFGGTLFPPVARRPRGLGPEGA
jgi:hypothetical protein